jgi:hypothetical protein
MLETAGSARLEAWVDAFVRTVTAAGRPCPVYAGGHYVPAGVPAFYPFWGSATNPSGAEAIQYGPGIRFGMSVDVDLVGSTFPLGSWTPTKPPTPPAPTPPDPNPEDDVTDQDKQDIANLVLAGIRALFAPPNGELYDRVIQADNQSAEETAGEIARAVVAAEKPSPPS